MTEPTRAVARYDGPRTTDELREYATLLAFDTDPEGRYKRNDALPAAFRGNPGAVAFAVEYGRALDVSPVTALVGIHIVDGKPTASAGLISALVRRAGHKIRTWTEGTVEGGDVKGITTIVRHDDPDFTYRSEWTLSRAVRAGLCTTVQDPNTGAWSVSAKGRSGRPGAWETYTENMLKSRSITECARDAVEDAIMGVHYTPEELGAEIDESGSVVQGEIVPPERVTSQRVDEPRPPSTPAAAPPAAPAPASSPDPAPPAGEGEGAPAPAETFEAKVARVRRQVFEATSVEELTDLWNRNGLDPDKARAVVVLDENGSESNLLTLFGSASTALSEGWRLVDTTRNDPGDEPDGGSPASPAGPEGDSPAPASNEPEAGAPDAGGTVEGKVVETPTTDPLTQGDHGPNAIAVVNVLDGIRRENPDAFDTVVAWAQGKGLNPYASEEQAAEILRGVESGEALPVSWPAQPETPVELLERILGAETLQEIPLRTTEERHARDMALRRAAQEEDRREAAEVARRGGAPSNAAGGGFDAYRAEREALNV